MFISAMLGWDDAELAEFKDAVELVPTPFRAFAQMMYAIVNVGTSLSPLHNRFLGKLGDEAALEASQLTAAKVEMH
jgi:hypothetical protein